MYYIHGFFWGGNRVVLEVTEIPKLQRTFKPLGVVYSKRRLDFDVSKTTFIPYDILGVYSYKGKKIPSFVLKIVDD